MNEYFEEILAVTITMVMLALLPIVGIILGLAISLILGRGSIAAFIGGFGAFTISPIFLLLSFIAIAYSILVNKQLEEKKSFVK